MDYIFHGSKKLFEVLRPNKAFGFGGEPDCHFGIYGVRNRNLAIPFTFTITSVGSNAAFQVKTDCEPPEVILENASIDWDKKGYLYTLPAASFRKVDDLQWVSEVEVIPLDITEIDPRLFKHWVKVKNSHST